LEWSAAGGVKWFVLRRKEICEVWSPTSAERCFSGEFCGAGEAGLGYSGKARFHQLAAEDCPGLGEV
jgi:hypothetical protein